MLWAKKNSYKKFDNEKKFLLLENSPPPITSLMVHPLEPKKGVCSRSKLLQSLFQAAR